MLPRLPDDLIEAFERRDLEAFRTLLARYADDTLSVTALIQLYINDFDHKPGDEIFLREAFRAGGEVTFLSLRSYLRRAIRLSGRNPSLPKIEYNATLFQEILDHVDKESSLDERDVSDFIKTVLEDGSYDCITRSFVHIQENAIPLPKGFGNFFGMYCFRFGITSPIEHLRAISRSGIDIVPYLAYMPSSFKERLHAEYLKKL